MIYFVTGATGRVGRFVVRRLRKAGQKVRVLTRTLAPAQLPPGVEVVVGDLEEPESFRDALQGVTGLHLLTSQGDGYAAVSTGPQLAEMAEAAGVRRVTLLWNGSLGPVEQSFMDSNLEWSVLQPGNFMANTLAWAHDIRRSSTVAEPLVDVPDALIDEADVGAVAAEVLLRGGHGGKHYPMSGPEALTIREQVAVLGQALGRDLSLVELDEHQARARWHEHGWSSGAIEFVLAARKDPPPAMRTVTSVVPDILGRPARMFRQWARQHRSYFL